VVSERQDIQAPEFWNRSDLDFEFDHANHALAGSMVADSAAELDCDNAATGRESGGGSGRCLRADSGVELTRIFGWK
jgi:hypothetical protein